MLNNIESMLDIDEKGSQFLTFILGEEEYGIDILQIQEIRGWGKVTNIPNMPEYILGVINLRGTIVPIMDLRKRFDQTNIEYNATTVIIVARARDEDHDRIVGMVVDAVSEVYDLNEKEMKPPPDLGGTVDSDFISGLVNVDDKMIILMDVDKLVSYEVKKHLSVAETTNQLIEKTA